MVSIGKRDRPDLKQKPIPSIPIINPFDCFDTNDDKAISICKYCDDSRPSFIVDCSSKSDAGTAFLNTYIAEGNKLIASAFAEFTKTFCTYDNRAYAEINYCPMCGRKLFKQKENDSNAI